MSDIFEETEENLRTEQYIKLARQALPWVSAALVAALVVALGIWGWQSWQTSVSAKASETFQAGLDANAKADKTTAKARFEDVVKAGNPNFKAMALMELAALADLDKKSDEAIKDLDDASKATGNPLISDTAALKAAYLVMDKGNYADVEKRLTPLTKDGRPVAALAKEALAMAKLQKGDVKGARADLSALSLTLGTPDGVKQRAQATVIAIDTGAAQTAIAAAKLPEASAPMLPGLPEAGTQVTPPAPQ